MKMCAVLGSWFLSTFPKKSSVSLLLLLVFGLPAHANLTNTWQFTNSVRYEVSDPTLIRANPADGGRAELILQAAETPNASVSNYLEWTRSNLSIGDPSSLRLTKTGSAYNYPGVFRSRVFDKGTAGPWQLISSDVDNAVFVSRNLKGEIPADAPGLVALYRLNNSLRDEVSGGTGIAPVQPAIFITSSKLGSHAAFVQENRQLRTVNSGLLNGAQELTISVWLRPSTSQAFPTFPGIVMFSSPFPVGFGYYGGDVLFRVTPDNNNANRMLVSTPLREDGWYLYTGVWDAATGGGAIYVNGVKQREVASSNARNAIEQSSAFMIGYNDANSQAAPASYDEVAIWNRRLSDREVMDLFLAVSSVDFRVRSSDALPLSGEFVGPDGSVDSFYLPGVSHFVTGGSFNPFHRYIQYETSLYSDIIGSDTPFISSIKLITSDGVVVHDSSLADFQQAESVALLTNYPAAQATPYLGLKRDADGAFANLGAYRSPVYDAGAGGFWQAVEWETPAEVPTDAAGVAGLWHLNGSWADSIGGVLGVPSGASLITDTAKLGTGAVRFDGSSDVTFPVSKAVRSLEFWAAPQGTDGGLLELNPGSAGGLVLSSENGTLSLLGGAAAGATLYVNASAHTRELLPGWNHIAIVLNANLTVTDMVLGTAAANPWQGLADELAIYNRALLKAEVVQHVASAVRQAGGRTLARVRTGNTLPLTGAFSGSYQSGQAIQISDRRYFQYELELSGGGMVTPAVRNVRVISSAGNFASATREDFAKGDFGSTTAWHGDSVQLIDLADRGAVGLATAGQSGLAALWTMDEKTWQEPGAQVLDSAGSSHGSPVGGADTESGSGGLGLFNGKFGGSGDYVALPAVSLPADFAVSVWFKSTSSTRSALVATELTGSRSYALELNGDGTGATVAGALTLVANGLSGQMLLVSQRRDLNDGNWHHAVAQRRGQQMHLYVDGVREYSAAVSGAVEDYGAGPLYMARYGGDAIYYSGSLDDLSIWTRALTSGEIGRIASAGFESAKTAMFESAVLDAGGASIWETLDWTSNGRFGDGLPDADSGLVGLWRCDEASGDLLNAVSPATLTASANALTYNHEGVFDQAIGLNFPNNVGAYASIPHSAALQAGTFSLSLWAYIESDNTRTLIDKRTAGAGYGLSLDASGYPVFWLSGTECKAPIRVARQQWTHLAAIYDGTAMQLYINGRLARRVVPVGVNLNSGAPLYIGRAYNSGGSFRGLLEDIAYYNRALSAMEAVAHYRAGAGTLAFQIRTSDTDTMAGAVYVGPDGTDTTWFTEPASQNLIGVAGLKRYFQYRGVFRSEDHRFSPTLYGVYVSASRYPENTPWIAPVAAAGYPFLGELLTFDHTRTFQADTDVRYQISGDAYSPVASNRWFYYNSTSGKWQQQSLTNAASIYQIETSTKDQVNAQIGKFYDQVYNSTGGLFRFKAFLKSGGDQPIAISNVTVAASEGRLVVVAPNGQERGAQAWLADVPYDIAWSWAGAVSDNLELAYSLNGYAGPFTVIASGLAAGAGGTNSYSWRTPQTPIENPTFTNVVVRIRDLNDASVMDVSDAPFEITRRFKVVAPNGGERWYIGQPNVIRWEASFGLSTFASIYFAPDGNNFFAEDGGTLVEYLAPNSNSSSDNSYIWNTPLNDASLLSTNARIMVRAPAGAYGDVSDAPFSMVGIVVTQPAKGQKVKRGDDFVVKWRSIEAGTNVHVDVSLDGGATYETNIYSFVANQDGENTLTWDVTQAESDTAVLRVRSLSDGLIIGYSEVFTIAGIDVIAPDGGEEWMAGSTNTIQWLAGGAGNSVSIFYTDLYDGTNTVWFPIAEGIPNTLSYNWVLSDRVSPLARVKVQSDEDPTLFAISEQSFSIAGVKVTYPNLFADTLVMGEQAIMTHSGAPERWLRVKLEISYDRAATWETLGPGAEEWTLRDPFPFRPDFPSRQTKVRATVLGATAPDRVTPLTNVVDLSDEYFTVEGMLMEAPVAGSVSTLGQPTEIRWVSAGGDPSATIYYSSQGTNNFKPIAEGVFNNQVWPGRNPYPWTVPTTLLPSIDARIKVVSGAYSAMTDPFTLRGIRITTPVSGDVWAVGSTHPVAWTFAGMDITSRGTISLSLDGGTTFDVLETDYDLISVPIYDWVIAPDLAPTTNALLRLEVTSSDTPADIGFIANSDRFTLKGIKILSPTAGGTVQLGQTNTISFISAAAGNSATITYSADGGATYDPVPVVANLPIVDGPNSFDWAVELNRTPSTNAVIKITGTADSKVSAVFTLGGIRVDRPQQFDIWAVSEINPIEWVAEVANPVFNLDLVYEDGFTLSVAQNLTGSSRQYQLPPSALRGQATISNVVLRVRDSNQTATGVSPPFRLVSQPIIEMVSPKAGDFLRVGDEVQITWIKGGSMQAEDFTVWFSGDNFATMEDVARGVTLNTANNTFSMPWLVPDRLGPTKIMVTNSANPSLTIFSGEFDIVGAFEVIFPNGGDEEEDIYANQTKAVSWFTEGTVPLVDIYYKAGAGAWTKVNSTPIDNNPRQGRYQTFYQWTAPTLRSDFMRLRVQDASYPDPDLFDGTRLGPYDDSDDTFPLKFYTVQWEVGYMHEDEDTGEIAFRGLDKLSVTDSSGWSVTGLESPFTTNYPYGTFDTVWYRQFFNDKVDFRWLSDRDQTRRLIMQPSDTEPDATVLANFTYDPGEESLTLHAWIERGGRILNNPDSTTIHIFDTDGTKLKQLSSFNVLADGFFRIKWENVLTPEGPLSQGETYLARVEVMYNRVIYSAAVTYTLSLAPEFQTVEDILEQVSGLESNLTGQVSGLTDLTTAFRDAAMDSLGNIEDQTGTILTNVNTMAGQMQGFTNTVVAPLAFLTNQFAEVFGPTLTNMAEQVDAIADATAGDQARILNRPATVEYGSTNSILYKTTRGLDAGKVRLTVEGTGRQFNMVEVGIGLGIYGVDIIADWGLGPFVISCSDPNASDRMILEVVQAGANSIGELAATLATLETQMTNMTEVMTALGDPDGGLSALMSNIDSSISSVESALGAALGGGGGAASAAGTLESLLAGGGGDSAEASLVNSLMGMSSRIEQIYGETSDAARFASSAKNEASTAVTAVRELKDMLETGEYSLEAAGERMDAIRMAMETANANIENIPRAVGADAMQSQINAVAMQIKTMAEMQGFAYEVALKQAAAAEGGGVGGEAADEDMITVLNENMNEVKVSLTFMQKVLDERMNQPVVQEDWLGVE